MFVSQCLLLCLTFVQTRYGGALAVPLFISLAQNRILSVVGMDRGVGNFNRQPAEDRIRVVSGRYDYTTKLMIQVSIALPLFLIRLDPDLDAMQGSMPKQVVKPSS